MRTFVLFLIAAIIGFMPLSGQAASASAQASASFTEAQRAEIESIVKTYLTEKNPQVLAEGLQNLQTRQQEEAEAKIKENIAKHKAEIYKDAATPSVGKDSAKVTVVEFFDYQCGYCKAAEEGMERVLKEDKDVRIVYKNFPILGPVSLEAAKASLASVKQGKFKEFHTAMMNRKEHLKSEMIYEIAKNVGLNVDKLKKDMDDKTVTENLAANTKLGESIGVRGTPFFIINDTTSPGVLSYDALKKVIDAARAEKK